MPFTSEFLEEGRSRFPLSRLIAPSVKLRRAGKEFVGCCPFHADKSPSFTVSDQKAFFHCFGCGEHGDHYSFLQKKTGCSFQEAVEQVASLAGLVIPQANPEAIKREARRLTIIEDLEKEQRRYVADLAVHEPVREYLRSRGVSEATATAFGLGYAEAGRYAGRLTVPIADLGGRIVGHGARSLNGAQPKYLNTAETEAFHKGSLLYNAHRARQLAHGGAQLVVVEGYPDCWSVDPHFPCVATMGTAITEAQLLGMWRLHQSPCIVMDGDAAGRRAVAKVIQTAFPLLLPGRGLKFATMPNGMDPDDVCRNSNYGPKALRRAVEASEPLSAVWWRICLENAPTGTPEALAGLETRLLGPAGQIPDEGLRKWFITDMRDRLRSLSQRPSIVRANGRSHHSANPGSIRLVHGPGNSGGLSLREAALIAKLTQRPGDMTEADLEAKGVSERTRLLLAEILSLMDTIPESELQAVLHAGSIGVAVDEAEKVCERAGITSLRRQ